MARRRRTYKVGCFGFIVLLAIIITIVLVGGAALIGIVAAWFLHTPWSVGWDAAWENPLKLFAFMVFILPIFVGGRASD